MYVLGIDTSTTTGGVALLQEEELIGESLLNIRTTHSERLLPALEELLSHANVLVEEIDLFTVVTGPGSFTGLRIGMATAKGFSFALQKPILGVTTLEAYGWQFRYFPGTVVSLIDARRKTAFWQSFKGGRALVEPSHAPLENILAWCRQKASEQLLFVGDGALSYTQEIKEAIPQAIFPDAPQSLLRPGATAHLGYRRFLAGEVHDAFSLNPTYMRKTEAERKWKHKA